MRADDWPRPLDSRVALQLLRLALLLVAGWLVTLQLGLAVRNGLEAGWGLGSDLPPANAPAMQIPPLGVTIESGAWEPGALPAELSRLADAGIGWVRVRFDWSRLEAQRGQFEWAEADALLAQIGAAGLVPVVVLDGSPAWARAAEDQQNPLAPPHNPADFALFAAAFAVRYGNSVRFYQVWDEPNIAPHWGRRHIDPVAYAQLLRQASSALRRTDGDAVVITAALAPTTDRGHLAVDEVFFLERMLAAGAAGSFDALAAQPFGFGHAPSHARQDVRVLNFQRVALLRRVLVTAGLAEIPIWAVRAGWNTRPDSPWRTVTPEDQVRYAGEARAVAARRPWLATLGWAVATPAAPQDDPVWGFALTDELLAAWTGPLPALPISEANPALPVGLWGAALLVALAWGVTLVRRLPQQRWVGRLRKMPDGAFALLWAGLLVLYFFATWPPLIFACLLAGAFFAPARPQSAVVLAAALLPFHFQHKEIALGVATLTLPPAAAMALALLPALAARAGQRPTMAQWRRSPAFLFDLLVIFWLLINLLAALGGWPRAAIVPATTHTVLVPVLLYLAVRAFLTTPAEIRRGVVGLAAGGVAVAVPGLVLWAGGRGVAVDGVLRLVGIYYSPNQTALYLLRSLFLAAGLALAASGLTRRLWFGAGGLLFMALLLTASRGALTLGLPAGLLVCFWLWTLRGDLPLAPRIRSVLQRPVVHLVLAALPLVLVGALLFGEARLLNRESVESRWLLWQAALDLWRARPLLGVGAGGFLWAYPAFLTSGLPVESNLLHPHNVWLELLTQAGLPALVWLVALVLLWLVRAARRMEEPPSALDWLAIALCGALAAALAHAQVDAFLSLADLAGWFFVALGLWGQLLSLEKPPLK